MIVSSGPFKLTKTPIVAPIATGGNFARVAELREIIPVHFPTRLRGMPVVVAPVTVERTEQARDAITSCTPLKLLAVPSLAKEHGVVFAEWWCHLL